MKITVSADYKALRAAAYPPLKDFAEAYVAKENGDPSLMQAYVAAVNAVKARYPKPEPPNPPGGKP